MIFLSAEAEKFANIGEAVVSVYTWNRSADYYSIVGLIS
jgi:hypothetical protein